MAVFFQSICSSSSGNCLTLWTERTRLVIDCGLGSMKKTRAVLDSLQAPQTTAVLLSHVHSDHIGYYPLKTLETAQLPVYLHEACRLQLKDRHFRDYGFSDLKTNFFLDEPFTIGDFQVRPFAVPHMPGFPTFGFEFYAEGKKVVVATDFLEWSGVFDRFLDADFIFVESNHDLKLLRQYYNPNSRYHLPNPQTAELLVNVQRSSRRAIRTVVLGHISSQRNKAAIALDETRRAFERSGLRMTFDLQAAPLKEPGLPVCIV